MGAVLAPDSQIAGPSRRPQDAPRGPVLLMFTKKWSE